MKLIIRQIGDLTLYAGVITEVREGSGNAAGRVVNIKLTGMEYDREKNTDVETAVDIAFWNSDKEGASQLADRAKKANLAVGKFVTVLARTVEAGKVFAVNFKYSGVWNFPEKDGQKELNVFVGSLGKVTEADGKVYTAIPISVDGNDEWCNIAFYNNEADEATGRKASNLANVAKRCFVERNGKRPKVVVVTGPKRTYNDSKGVERTSYTAYSFDMQPDAAYNNQN